MSQKSDHVVPTPPKWGDLAEEQIRAQVERVLASPLFRTSQRCQALLRHVAEHALAGDTEGFKERNLGIDVFGRVPDYDTNADPVVRSTAGEIRKKLAQYYQDAEHSSEIRIELSRGSYVPTFHTSPTPLALAPVPAVPYRFPTGRMVLIALSVLVLAVLGGWLFGQWRKTALDRFWGPMFDSPSGVLFALAQPKVYNFRSDARQKEIEGLIQKMSPSELESSRESIPLSQLVPMWDRYLAAGDVNCLLRLASVFDKHGKPYRIRRETAISFTDLREGPSVLIGAFDNEWTLRAVGEMRFTFFKDFQGLELIHDRDHPEKTDWKLVNSWPEWKIANDFAIVSRVFDQHTDRMVVIAAGITHFGTSGAGDFLSNPDYFAEAVPRLPHDWQRRNLQIVLRIPVVEGVSGHPQVLATHVW